MWSFAGKVMILGGSVIGGKRDAIEIIDVDNFSFTCPADPTFTPLPDSSLWGFGSGLVPFGTDSRPLVCGGSRLGSNCQYLDNR